MTLEPVEQCSRDAMTAALNEDNVIGGSYALNPDVLIADSLLLPSEGTLAIGGLVSDEGIACTHHLAALDFLGAAMTGTMEMDEASREALEARAERLSEQAAAMDLENMTEEDAANMTPAQRRRMMAMVNDAMQVTRPVSEDQEDVVLNLYSPHLTTWQFGMLSIPWATKHTGLGGWAANAAANLVIQLPGTNPSDLQEGETYAAVASAPTSDPDGTQEALSTMIGFYTRWTGTFQDVPYPLPSTPSEAQRQAESRAACEQVKLQYAHLLATTGAVDVLLNPHPWQSLDCHNKGLAFQGTTEVVSGELSGTVTIEAITGAEVTGRFNLNGIGTLETETTTFTYEEGLLTGSDGETTQRNGPVTMRGTFSAPYRIAGIPRMIGYRTVIIE